MNTDSQGALPGGGHEAHGANRKWDECGWEWTHRARDARVVATVLLDILDRRAHHAIHDINILAIVVLTEEVRRILLQGRKQVGHITWGECWSRIQPTVDSKLPA